MFYIKKGFTLIELLVVIAIMGIMAGAVAPHVMAMIDRNSKNTTVVELDEIKQALLDYYSDNAVVPATSIGGSSGLVALVWNAEALNTWKGPYVSSSSAKVLSDQFRVPYQYHATNANGSKAVVLSTGKDRVTVNSNYDNFDFTIAKDATTTGFPWDVSGDDLIINVTAKGSAAGGATIAQTLTDTMNALFQCAQTGAYAGISCPGNNDLYCNMGSQITGTFTDPFGGSIIFVSCKVVDSQFSDKLAFVYSLGGGSNMVAGNEKDICDDIDNGNPIGTKGGTTYSPNIINGINGNNASPQVAFETGAPNSGNNSCPWLP